MIEDDLIYFCTVKLPPDVTIHNWRVGAITENIFIVALLRQKRPICVEIEVYKPGLEVYYYNIQVKPPAIK